MQGVHWQLHLSPVSLVLQDTQDPHPQETSQYPVYSMLTREGAVLAVVVVVEKGKEIQDN
jgi:hypothetical protein